MIVIEPIPVTSSVLASTNVPASETPYLPGGVYALGQIVESGNLLYESMVAANSGNPLTDSTKWLLRGASNRYKMFDAFNNTQTTNPESIVVSLNPVLIANGFFIGGADADSFTVTVTDAIDGVVFSETQSLIQSNSASSFFNWCFKRIARRTAAVLLTLPMYAGATITISIDKPGGIAKCGMCVVGPIVDIGLSTYGISTDIKDFSTTQFNADGTSKTVERDFAKRMSIEVQLENDVIDVVQETLAAYRQRPVVWVGVVRHKSTIVYGKYSSFKNVIPNLNRSRMALQIEGMI
ncbi:MAG: hypothetical protein H7Z39_20645 [Burkholderiaceae bacterium]|nr:hypothetical protein [Burkholderiaceae bacterium]